MKLLIEHVQIYGFGAAMRAMRNPRRSWARSDTVGETIGPEDLELACRLVKAGPSHRKFLRQIVIWADLILPRYVWTEWDTYKVATTRNSCSTMNDLRHRNLSREDFVDGMITSEALDHLNTLIAVYRKYRNPEALRHVKAHLPESYLQRATITISYETALHMYLERQRHRLPEWRAGDPESLCSWIYELPNMARFIAAVECRIALPARRQSKQGTPPRCVYCT
jgi:hypothetical protein